MFVPTEECTEVTSVKTTGNSHYFLFFSTTKTYFFLPVKLFIRLRIESFLIKIITIKYIFGLVNGCL